MSPDSALPWYKRTVRWGQTNITELDAARYDIGWWREYWRRTQVQGVIINAGGIVAYYPSREPLHYRAQFLGERDLFGELRAAASEEGLAVLARMDSNRATEEFYQQYPHWFARKADGTPYRAGGRYVACIFSAYYDEFLTGILREIIELYQPEGFTDNSWSGLDRNSICYCENCQRHFREEYSYDLPTSVDWESAVYRTWIRWNYDRRLAVWDLNNHVVQEVGGPHCLWLGMNSGNIHHQALRFRDHKAICERTPILMLDHQRRGAQGFQQNGDTGKLCHGLMGWDALMPESMSQYQSGMPTFRLSAKPEVEARMWMLAGFAGGIQPWWHFISAYHEDRRQYRTAVPVMEWYATNQAYLLHRQPIATVGVVWSQENVDFYGRDQGEERVMAPYFGLMQALIRSRIPFLPIHADHIARESGKLAVLVLPNLAAMSEAQIAAVRHFVAQGGGLIASGESSLYTEWGERRNDFALADLFGAHVTGEAEGEIGKAQSSWEAFANHTYLRLHPAMRGQVDGPLNGTEPAILGQRHSVLAGFEETDILGFGGRLEGVALDENAEDLQVLLTFIPGFPIYPPEFAWMRATDSGRPALLVREPNQGGRVAYLAADIDRLFGLYNLPDHSQLLANLVRWAAQDRIPLQMEGGGLIDCHLYQQPGRLILHMVNLSASGHEPMHESIAVGPLKVAVELPADVMATSAQMRVMGESLAVSVRAGWAHLEIPSLLDHELVVIE